MAKDSARLGNVQDPLGSVLQCGEFSFCKANIWPLAPVHSIEMLFRFCDDESEWVPISMFQKLRGLEFFNSLRLQFTAVAATVEVRVVS